MGGALLGAALAFVPGVAWANDCRRLGRACRRDSRCCSRNCVRRGDDKVCGCPEGQTRCNDRCVNLNRNENHCGECFNRCAEEEECVRGMCQGGGGICATGGSCTVGFPFPCQSHEAASAPRRQRAQPSARSLSPVLILTPWAARAVRIAQVVGCVQTPAALDRGQYATHHAGRLLAVPHRQRTTKE